jgi:hypothetical protein
MEATHCLRGGLKLRRHSITRRGTLANRTAAGLVLALTALTCAGTAAGPNGAASDAKEGRE